MFVMKLLIVIYITLYYYFHLDIMFFSNNSFGDVIQLIRFKQLCKWSMMRLFWLFIVSCGFVGQTLCWTFLRVSFYDRNV